MLLHGSATVLGQEIAWPSGKPAVKRPLACRRGAALRWRLAVEHGPDGGMVCRAGDALLEALRARQNGRSSGAEEVRLLAVANTVMAPE